MFFRNSKPKPEFHTEDWQWFLADLKTKVRQQLEPDANTVERLNAEERMAAATESTPAAASPPLPLPKPYHGGGNGSPSGLPAGCPVTPALADESSPVAQPSNNTTTSVSTLSGRRSGSGSGWGKSPTSDRADFRGYGTFQDFPVVCVAQHGSVNDSTDEEMPIIVPRIPKVPS